VGNLVHDFVQHLVQASDGRTRIDGTEEPLEETRFRRHERTPFIGAIGAVAAPDPEQVRLPCEDHAPAPVLRHDLLNGFAARFQSLDKPMGKGTPVDAGIRFPILAGLDPKERSPDP
jgi:hypothetical protein